MEVVLEYSAAVHYLDRSHPCYEQLLAVCEKIVSVAKRYKNPKVHSPIRFTQWIYVFLLIRNALRDQAITMLCEEPGEYNPIKEVDRAVSGGAPAP